MKFIKMKGIKKIEKKLQASILGGKCRQTVGGVRYFCTTYNIEIHGMAQYEDEVADTLTKHVNQSQSEDVSQN